MCCLQDGVHQSEAAAPEYTEEQLKLIHSQDLRYVNYKRSTELKVRERGTISKKFLGSKNNCCNFFVLTEDQ